MSDNVNFQDLSERITTEEHVQDVVNMVHMLLDFHEEREATYQMSFAKRGLIGVWMNLARKYDRLDPIAEEYFQYDVKSSVILVDALVDTAIYALKWLALLNRLEMLENEDMGMTQWLRDVASKELGVSLPELHRRLATMEPKDPQDFETEEAWDEYRNELQKSSRFELPAAAPESKKGQVTEDTKILRG